MHIFKTPAAQRLLNHLQVLIKTDVRYLIRGTAFLSIGQVFAALSGFLLTIALVRILNQAEYGLYTYILTLAGIVGMFTHSGMDTAVAQAVAKGFDRALLIGFWAKMKWSAPAAFIALCVGFYYLYQDNEILGYSSLIIGLSTPLLASSSLYGSYFNGKRQFKKLAYDNAFKNATISICVLIVAYVTRDAVLIVLAYFFTNTIISAVRFFHLTKKLPSSDETTTSTISIGKHLSLMEFFGNVSVYVDKIIVFQFLGATSLALYSLALAPTKQLQSVSRIIRALVLPKFTNRTALELKKTMHHKIFIFLLVAVAISTAYCILAQLFFITFFPQYEKALLYSQVLSLSLLFMPSILHTQALTALDMKKELYIVNILKSVTKIGLILMLVPFWGIWGAILAFLLAQFFTSVSLLFFFQRIKM